MKTIFLRHGIAEDHGEKDDFDRKLTEKGIKKLEKHLPALADYLKGKDFEIWSSPKLRARETAEILQGLTEKKDLPLKDFIADGSTQGFLEEFSKASSELVVLVGHEPHLSTWLYEFTGQDQYLKKGGACEIELNLEEGEGNCNWYYKGKEFSKYLVASSENPEKENQGKEKKKDKKEKKQDKKEEKKSQKKDKVKKKDKKEEKKKEKKKDKKKNKKTSKDKEAEKMFLNQEKESEMPKEDLLTFKEEIEEDPKKEDLSIEDQIAHEKDLKEKDEDTQDLGLEDLTLVEEGATLDEVAKLVLKEEFNKILENRRKFLEDTNESRTIHQYRVAIRRFRGILTVLKSFIDQETYERVQGTFRDLGAKAGYLRELDVLIDRYKPLSYEQEVLRTHSTVLKKLRSERRIEKEVLREEFYLDDHRAAMINAFTEFVIGLKWKDMKKIKASPFIEEILDKWENQIEEGLETYGEFNLEETHKIRLKAKKYRYASKAFEEHLPPDYLESHVKMKNVQTILGDVCDAIRNQEALTEIFPEEDQAEKEFLYFVDKEKEREDYYKEKLLNKDWDLFEEIPEDIKSQSEELEDEKDLKEGMEELGVKIDGPEEKEEK